MKNRVWVAVLVVGMLVFAACGNGDTGDAAGSGGSSAAPSPSSASPSDGGRYGYDYGSGGQNGGGDGGGSSSSADAGKADVTAEASNFEFTPSTIRVASGDVLAIENTEASTAHTFTVAGEDIDVMLDPDSSATVTIDLPAGSYPFECRFHGSSGMTGTLVVS